MDEANETLSLDEVISWMKRRTDQELRDWRRSCESILNVVALSDYPSERAVAIRDKYESRIAAIDAELASRKQGGAA